MTLHKIIGNGPSDICTLVVVVWVWVPRAIQIDIPGSDCETTSENWSQRDIDWGYKGNKTPLGYQELEWLEKESCIGLGTCPYYCFWYLIRTSCKIYVRKVLCSELVWCRLHSRSSISIFLCFEVLWERIWQLVFFLFETPSLCYILKFIRSIYVLKGEIVTVFRCWFFFVGWAIVTIKRSV